MAEPDDLDVEWFFATHRESSDTVIRVLEARTAPRHRARRHQWKPPLEPVQAQHLNHSDTFVR